MTEVWLPVDGFDYEVSDRGHVRNAATGRILRPFHRGFGNAYLGVDLCRDGKRYPRKVHRLVAEAFIGKPKQRRRREVNHLDCDPENNAVENLEWCTRSENEAHKRIMEPPAAWEEATA